MQDLVGRIAALDAAATEPLKIIAYFDSLLASGVGVDPLLRAAAALSDATAGARLSGRVHRFTPAGERIDAGDGEPASAAWLRQELSTGEAWIERAPPGNANDAMVLERLAMSLEIVQDRRTRPTRSALEVACDAAAPEPERADALARLGLAPDRPARVEARPAKPEAEDSAPAGVRAANCVMATSRGLVRVALLAGGPDDAPRTGRRGIGLAAPAIALPESFESALLALRVSDAAPVDAASLGAALWLLRAADATGAVHPDVQRLSELPQREAALETLDALNATGTVRGTAAALGLHHSTVQQRLASLTADLGYDPRSGAGRTRYALARMLQRAADARFD